MKGWRRVVLWPLAFLVRLWGRSLRMEASPAALAALRKNDEPVALVLWHNRLFLSAEIYCRYRQGRPIYALISASKDGAWLDAFLAMVGVQAVRGSSHKLGREAVSTLVEHTRAGHDIAVTPDGPKGPCYEVKPGVLIVTRRRRVPMVVIGADFDSAWRVKSWDRFYIPKPFSRVRMRCEILTTEQLANDRDAAAVQLGARLLALNPDHEVESRRSRNSNGSATV